VKVDPRIDAEKTNIPHMMVQPFVENAIWHGLLPKEGQRSLVVSFEYDTSRTISCTVDDNGIGRKNNINRQATFKKKSLALSFVKQRLELMKKDLEVDCSVQILDKEDEKGNSFGTLVKINLPILEQYVTSDNH
jgi:LytS/YehU family sensor histidine kinase